jgi:hypothetical protein
VSNQPPALRAFKKGDIFLLGKFGNRSPASAKKREHLFDFMSEPLRIVSVINEDENTPDFVSRVRVGVRLCDLSERIPSADDCSELS